MNKKSVHRKKTFAVISILTLFALGCQVASNLLATPTPVPTSTPLPTNTPVPTATSTKIPLSQMDLEWVTLHPDEVPVDLVPSESLSGPEAMKEIFQDHEQVHTGVLNSQYTSYATEDFHLFYVNGIFVYSDRTQATQAFNQISAGQSEEVESNPDIGDYAEVRVTALSSFTSIMVLWRYQDALAYLTVTTIDDSAPSPEDVIQLAQKVQERLEGDAP